MCLFQRSSDYATAGAINQIQYAVLQLLVARHLGIKAGKFTWFVANIQIYDRHIKQVKEMLTREPVNINLNVWLNPDKHNFYDFTVDDIKLLGYNYKEINKINPQLKFEIGI
jgi:thymidylate synthase